MKYSRICEMVQAPGTGCTVSFEKHEATINGPKGSITIPSLGKAPPDAAEKVQAATGVERRFLALKAATRT